MKIKCVAVDDEPLALELLADNISRIPYLELVDQCRNAQDLMACLSTKEVDLIFLDIQMPMMTGMEFLSSQMKLPMVILVTAYEKYALASYELNVVDYLVKPVEFSRFVKAAGKALEIWNLRGKSTKVKVATDSIFVNEDYQLVKVDFSDIIYFEGLKDYVKIYLKSRSYPLVTRMTMKHLEDVLPSNVFFRIHRSFIVSISAVQKIQRTKVELAMDKTIPVGETYVDDFFSRLSIFKS